MTKKQAKALKVGDTVIDRRSGIEYPVLSVCATWNGALTSAELEARRNDPDYYSVAVKVVPQKRIEYFKHTELRLAE